MVLFVSVTLIATTVQFFITVRFFEVFSGRAVVELSTAKTLRLTFT